MSVPELCIRRPVMTTLVMLGLMAFGILAYRILPVSDLPSVDFPTISVSASLPGASPETMASSVATPLEKQFSTIAGIDSMVSTSSLGSTSVTLQFALSRDIDAAALDVQTAISSALRVLPTTMPSPPTFRKVNPADSPILFLALLSDTMPLSKVDEYAQTVLSPRISTVSGVAQVGIYGTQKYAVRVQVNPVSLAARGLTMAEVRTAISLGNSNLPTGTLDGKNQTFTVKTSGQLMDAAGYRELVVTYRDGAPVRLGDVATVLDSVENDRQAAWFNDRQAIILSIQRQPGTNTVEIVDSIKALLPSIREQLPPAVTLELMLDRSQPIRESVHDVQFTLILSIGLVVLVIFLFLRRLTATIIPSVAILLSIIATFPVMHLLGFSLNNLSLMALTLCVGFVVDDAIVVLENIVRHIEMGKSRMQAAREGSREIAFTVVSMTISLAAVFLPVLFMGGVLGRLFNEFAVTIGVAILISGFVSLTLTPMLCSRYLKGGGHQEKPGPFFRVVEGGINGMRSFYERTLRSVLAHPFLTLMATFATIGVTVWGFMAVPKGFIPAEDIGQIQVTTEAAQDISYDSMVEHQQAVAAILLKNPYVSNFTSSVGAGGPNSTANNGRLSVRLKPRKERPSANKIVDDLRVKLSQVPGVRVFAQVPPLIRLGGRSTKSQYQFTLSGVDLTQLYSLAPQVEGKLRTLPGLIDVTTDLQLKNPQVFVKVDRDKAATLGITADQVDNALYDAFGSRQVSNIYTPADEYDVILEVKPYFQDDPGRLTRIYLRSTAGDFVPIESVATISPQTGPLTVNHSGQLPSVTVSFNLQPGVSIGEAVDRIQTAVRDIVPAGIVTTFQGDAQAFQQSLGNLTMLLIMAVMVIYLVLGILYESFIHPLTILSTLPSAGVGALLILMAGGYDLSVIALIGIILLIGIVKKNGIMMVDFALHAERDRGMSPHDAIYQACLLRFRPIMMTTMCALLSGLPLMLGTGAGSELRRPLGFAMVGGLLLSQMLTLFTTPVVYLYLDRAHYWYVKRKDARAARKAAKAASA